MDCLWDLISLTWRFRNLMEFHEIQWTAMGSYEVLCTFNESFCEVHEIWSGLNGMEWDSTICSWDWRESQMDINEFIGNWTEKATNFMDLWMKNGKVINNWCTSRRIWRYDILTIPNHYASPLITLNGHTDSLPRLWQAAEAQAGNVMGISIEKKAFGYSTKLWGRLENHHVWKVDHEKIWTRIWGNKKKNIAVLE